jgi:hypothetical protein
MGAHDSANQLSRFFNGPTVLLATAILLPGLAPALFGWLSGVLAIPVCCLLAFYGTSRGKILVRNGAILAVAGAFLLKQLPGTLFTLTLIPLGFSLHRSAQSGDDETQTGLKGALVLGAGWLAFWSVYGAIEGANPYTQLLHVLDTGLARTVELYAASSDIPLETQVQIQRLVTGLRVLIPKILPGLLVSTLLLTVWINMLGSLALLTRLQPDKAAWKKYSDWRLPDRFVWTPIAAGFAWMFGTGIVYSAGLSLVLISVLLYFFQGLAVLIFFLDRWNIPLYLKILIYGILIFQSYGLLLVSLAGIADVWMDFRRRGTGDDKPED